MKKKKAPGEDTLKNEIWMYSGEAVIEKVTKILNRIWKGEDQMPER